MLRNQVFLSKHANISFAESDAMTYFEFLKVIKVTIDYIKESGPQMSDIIM